MAVAFKVGALYRSRFMIITAMDTFTNTFGGVAALCLGIIIVSVYFTLLRYTTRAISGNKVVKLKGFIMDAALVNIHAVGGNKIGADEICWIYGKPISEGKRSASVEK